MPRLRIVPYTLKDLEQAWKSFERPDLHKLSPVDALSFVLMTGRRIRVAFAFNSHFATAGFRMGGLRPPATAASNPGWGRECHPLGSSAHSVGLEVLLDLSARLPRFAPAG